MVVSIREAKTKKTIYKPNSPEKFSNAVIVSNSGNTNSVGRSNAPTSIPDYEKQVKSSLPYPELIQWRPTGYAYQNLALGKKIDLPSDVKTLYPATPLQHQKKYHKYEWGAYQIKTFQQHQDLANSEVAQIVSKGKRKFVQKADTAYYKELSDTYFYVKDGKKHFVRAVSQEAHLKQHETMGHGVSPGRAMLAKPNTEFHNDMYSGGTHQVNKSRFVKFFALTEKEERELKKVFELSRELGYTLDNNGLLFREPPPEKIKDL